MTTAERLAPYPEPMAANMDAGVTARARVPRPVLLYSGG